MLKLDVLKSKADILEGDFKRGYKQGIQYVEEGWKLPLLTDRMLSDLKDGYFNLDHFRGYCEFVRDLYDL